MMRHSRILAALVLSASLLGGCSFVSSAQGGDSGLTGEAWYVRTGFFGNTKVFYCPPDSTTCYRAEMTR